LANKSVAVTTKKETLPSEYPDEPPREANIPQSPLKSALISLAYTSFAWMRACLAHSALW
jgi:hypothetical protein